MNGEQYHLQRVWAKTLAKMVEDGKGCYVGVKRLGIAKVANPHVIYNGLDEDLDTTLSGLIGLLVLE